MGWNSWDCFGTSVTEDEVLANAEFMAEHLLPYGWDTVVVDIQWYEPDGPRRRLQRGAAPGAGRVRAAAARRRTGSRRPPTARSGRWPTRIHDLGLRSACTSCGASRARPSSGPAGTRDGYTGRRDRRPRQRVPLEPGQLRPGPRPSRRPGVLRLPARAVRRVGRGLRQARRRALPVPRSGDRRLSRERSSGAGGRSC